MALQQNTVFFALHCIQRIRRCAFGKLDLIWYPHRLLVVGLMLANQREYTSPYPIKTSFPPTNSRPSPRRCSILEV